MDIKFKKNKATDLTEKKLVCIPEKNINISISTGTVSDKSLYSESIDVQGDTIECIEMSPIVLQKAMPKPKKVQLITTVTEETREKLKAIAKQKGISLNVLLNAVFDAIITKYDE